MKILAVTPFPPQKNGGSTSIFEFFSRLSKNGYQFIVISYLKSIKFSNNLESIGMEVSERTSIARGIKFICKAFITGLKVFQKDKFDLIYGKNITSPSFVAFLISIFKKKPLVVHTSGGDIQEMDKNYKGYKSTRGLIFCLTSFFRKIILKQSSLIIANCITDFKVLKKIGFESKTVLIRNGVDTSKFYPPESKILPRYSRLIFVGRPEPEKNPDHILKISKLVKNQIIIIGGTQDEFSKFGHISKNVRIIGITDEIEKYYRQADIFIQTSSSEGLSNALLEAMASGNVPITYPSGDAFFLIKNGYNGYLCNSLEEIVERVKFLDNNKEEIYRLSKNAIKTIRSEFDWNNSVNKLNEILSKKFKNVGKAI